MRASRKIYGVLVLIALSLVACSPRGETKSLDEILQLARERYSAVADVTVDPQVGQTLRVVSQNLSDLEKPLGLPQFAEKSQTVAELLAGLDRKAGYTSRVSFADIADQFRVISGQALNDSGMDAKSHAARVKLLLARTYGLLASELETTKFAIG